MPIAFLVILFTFSFSLSAEACDMRDRLGHESPAKKLLQLSRDAMKAERYCRASKYYQETILQHPNSKEAKNAQLEIIYALGNAKEYKEAIRSARDFLIYFPRHRKKEEILRYIDELELKEKRARRLGKPTVEFYPLPEWPHEQGGYVYPGNEGAWGQMIRISWPF